jgi:hypothetical protein
MAKRAKKKRRRARKAMQSHPFAWDGVSFLVPERWNLSGYSFKKGVTYTEFEDEYGLRLEAQWLRPESTLKAAKVQKRYARAAGKLSRVAEKTTQLENVPPGWSAFLYKLAEERQVLTAFILPEDSSLFAFFRFHFDQKDAERPGEALKLITSSFRTYHQGNVPWAVYDVSFELPFEFNLTSTSFQAGRKMFSFEWRMRRFYLWFFSLADILLKGCVLEEWAADFLNAFKGIKGPTFFPGEDGEIRIRRTWRYRLGHVEEIGRLSFRYAAKAIHDREKNRIILWAYNYRRPGDLDRIPECLL